MPVPTPTNRYMNIGNTSFGGTVVTGITDMTFDRGISDKREGSDGDPGPTVAVVDFRDPTFSITTYDAFALAAVMDGTRGVFITTLMDAYNKALTGGGAKILTTNALSYIIGGAVSARYREFGTLQIAIHTVWADPATPPVSTTAA